MKKGISIILLILLCNSLFYCCYFAFSIVSVKLEAGYKISQIKEPQKTQVIKVPVNMLERDESDEVWYQHKLFDVISRGVINDTSYVFLLRDKDEEQLITENYNYFRTDTEVFYNGCFQI